MAQGVFVIDGVGSYTLNKVTQSVSYTFTRYFVIEGVPGTPLGGGVHANVILVSDVFGEADRFVGFAGSTKAITGALDVAADSPMLLNDDTLNI
jgi:hypothetical protein